MDLKSDPPPPAAPRWKAAAGLAAALCPPLWNSLDKSPPPRPAVAPALPGNPGICPPALNCPGMPGPPRRFPANGFRCIPPNGDGLCRPKKGDIFLGGIHLTPFLFGFFVQYYNMQAKRKRLACKKSFFLPVNGTKISICIRGHAEIGIFRGCRL
ncbi:hypothetical protein Bcoa_2790 [Heyndrickxia coagulans 36D1]|uniref:Uncharacterized protein n=1 Tax=Heyndrickxia coagulans 36D1 TaxID=345219 RepID=G2TPK4_HEYCO|nr:hypothetical protein Bcoa_2790 [Heyndrickxia coagulans 36D1]